MVMIRQRQQTAGARSRAESSKQKNQQSDTMSRRTTEDAKGGGDQNDRLCLQKGYLNVRFMVGKQTSASATFNLARSLKSFIIAGRQFEANFCLLSLHGDGNPLSRPQDVPNNKYAITFYYRHRLGAIAQLKHATSTFKEYLLKVRVHINNAQLEPEEAVVLG
jgi:hypothetical protein